MVADAEGPQTIRNLSARPPAIAMNSFVQEAVVALFIPMAMPHISGVHWIHDSRARGELFAVSLNKQVFNCIHVSQHNGQVEHLCTRVGVVAAPSQNLTTKCKSGAKRAQTRVGP